MGKALIFIGTVLLIYLIFFRKKIKPDGENKDSFELIECAKCKTYVVKTEAIIKDSKYYCSPKCLES
ncbi:PP0621 family protein [Helicobacter sp. MIT 14-3879]|uniref:PP0621 family protein n=1 Tax=Helicobacter sp. MIT 14-3879 TaxID=2040649 RepID=UPI000E1F6F48|nr:PP0621 family protein [Helicobacter sp. MIT 14-3879]RDU62867.1 hypothetical protein CQA44_06110 [Helicobacter sp. MIT 14-3879]